MTWMWPVGASCLRWGGCLEAYTFFWLRHLKVLKITHIAIEQFLVKKQPFPAWFYFFWKLQPHSSLSVTNFPIRNKKIHGIILSNFIFYSKLFWLTSLHATCHALRTDHNKLSVSWLAGQLGYGGDDLGGLVHWLLAAFWS